MLVENYMKQQIADIQSDPEKKAKMEDEIIAMTEQGMSLEEAEGQFIEKTKSALMEDLKKFGEDRFPEIAKKIFDVGYDIDIEIGDEQINKGVMVNQLVQVMGMLGQMGQPIDGVAKEIFDALGLDSEKLVQRLKQPEPTPEAIPAPLPTAQPIEANAVPTTV
jgi:hypothetical protein